MQMFFYNKILLFTLLKINQFSTGCLISTFLKQHSLLSLLFPTLVLFPSPLQADTFWVDSGFSLILEFSLLFLVCLKHLASSRVNLANELSHDLAFTLLGHIR